MTVLGPDAARWSAATTAAWGLPRQTSDLRTDWRAAIGAHRSSTEPWQERACVLRIRQLAERQQREPRRLDDVPVPWCLGQPGCGAYPTRGFAGRPAPCEAPTVWAGLVLVESRRPVELWVEFACAEHVGKLRAPRQLLERDLALLEWRREQTAAGRAGRRYVKPGPLATGPEARDRFRRALASP